MGGGGCGAGAPPRKWKGRGAGAPPQNAIGVNFLALNFSSTGKMDCLTASTAGAFTKIARTLQAEAFWEEQCLPCFLCLDLFLVHFCFGGSFKASISPMSLPTNVWLALSRTLSTSFLMAPGKASCASLISSRRAQHYYFQLQPNRGR